MALLIRIFKDGQLLGETKYQGSYFGHPAFLLLLVQEHIVPPAIGGQG